MDFFMDFILLAMTAITLENAIFTRALGIGKTVFTVHRGRQILVYGGMVTVITMLSSMAGYWMTGLMTWWGWRQFTRPATLPSDFCRSASPPGPTDTFPWPPLTARCWAR